MKGGASSASKTVAAIGVLLAAGCTSEAALRCGDLKRDQIIAIVADLVKEDVDPAGLRYRIARGGRGYVVTSEFREPTPGFLPTIEIDRRDCAAHVIRWE